MGGEIYVSVAFAVLAVLAAFALAFALVLESSR